MDSTTLALAEALNRTPASSWEVIFGQALPRRANRVVMPTVSHMATQILDQNHAITVFLPDASTIAAPGSYETLSWRTNGCILVDLYYGGLIIVQTYPDVGYGAPVACCTFGWCRSPKLPLRTYLCQLSTVGENTSCRHRTVWRGPDVFRVLPPLAQSASMIVEGGTGIKSKWSHHRAP